MTKPDFYVDPVLLHIALGFFPFVNSKLPQYLNAILSAYCSASAQTPFSVLPACQDRLFPPSTTTYLCKAPTCSPLALPAGRGQRCLPPHPSSHTSLFSHTGCNGLPAAGQQRAVCACEPGWKVCTCCGF